VKLSVKHSNIFLNGIRLAGHRVAGLLLKFEFGIPEMRIRVTNP
jgi:hypothetical protein